MNLAMLDRAQKTNLLYLLAEKERRRKEYARRYFVPQEQQKQPLKAIFSNKYKEVWAFGGNRSGKTELGGYGACKIAVENSDTLVWVASETFEAQVDTTQEKIMRYLHTDEIAKITYRFRDIIYKIFLRNGSVIQFKSYEQDRKKFQGANVPYIWLDEEPPKEIYQECLMRTIDSSGKIVVTMTPVVGRQYIFDKTQRVEPHIAIFYLDTLKNEYLSQDEVNKIRSAFSEDELEMRLQGKFIQRSGLVYKEFDRNLHVIDPFPIPEEWYVVSGVDYGYNNPTAVLWLVVDPDGNYYIVDEHYMREMLIEDHARIIKEKDAKYKNIGPRWIDPSTAARQGITGTSIQLELTQKGVYTIPANNDVYAGIQLVKQALSQIAGDGKPRLRIFRTCINLINEFENYVWTEVTDSITDDSRREKPKKVNDHAMDALRYILINKPVFRRKELRRPRRQAAGYASTGY